MHFILEKQRILVTYDKGRSYPPCPNKPTKTALSLNCAPENIWNYTGNTGDASSHIVAMFPSVDGCSVSLDVPHNTLVLVLV